MNEEEFINEVNNFLDNQAVVQIFKEQKKPNIFSSIIVDKIRTKFLF